MALDLLALALVCVFAGFGAARGAFAGAVGLMRLFLAAAAGLLLGPLLGPGLASAAALPGPGGTALAGTLAFAFFYVVLGLLARWLRRLEERRIGLSRTPVDRLGGAALGALRGVVAAVPLVWMVLWIDVLRVAGIAPGLPELPPSRAVAATEAAVETGTLAYVGDDPGGRVAARLAARPAATIGQLEWLVSDPRVVDLRADPAFWDSVERGKVDAALARPSFERLAGDAGLRRKLAAVGLVEAEAAEDPAGFQAAMADVLRELGPRLHALRQDGELERLLEDPEVAKLARSGNSLALMKHPAVREAVVRALEKHPATAP